MASKKKIDIVDKVISSLSENTNFALIKFGKTTHATLEDLRRELKKSESKFSVVKNTLFEKAINKLSQSKKDFVTMSKKSFPLVDKSALLVFKGDWAEGLKGYYEKIKENESFSFKFGYIDQEIYEANDLVKLSKLPAKDELRAKIIGTMQNPIVRTTRSLKFNMQKFVYILSQKAQA